MKKFRIMAIVAGVIALSSCDPDAYVASRNVSQAADNFEVFRRAVFYNGITGEYMLTIEGYLSIMDDGNQLEVTVRDDQTYLKHFLGLSDNVTYFVEQIEGLSVSDRRYRVTFKPSTIVPMVDLR